jgi:hypothetical protein
LVAKDIADSLITEGGSKLPAGVAGILVGQRLANGEAVAVALERPVQITLIAKDIAESFVTKD